MNHPPKEGGQMEKTMAINSDALQSMTSVPPVINQPGPSEPTFGSSKIKSIDIYSDSDDELGEYEDAESRSAREGAAEEVITVSSYPKRNRPSVNYDEGIWNIKIPDPKRTKITPTNLRGVIVGTWKDSEQLDDHNKHIVHGFIDDWKRLRFRLYGTNRQHSKSLPLPPGASGCWVKFQDITFDPHLSTKTSDQIKEYVISKSQEDQKQSEELSRESPDVDDDDNVKVDDLIIA